MACNCFCCLICLHGGLAVVRLRGVNIWKGATGWDENWWFRPVCTFICLDTICDIQRGISHSFSFVGFVQGEGVMDIIVVVVKIVYDTYV